MNIARLEACKCVSLLDGLASLAATAAQGMAFSNIAQLQFEVDNWIDLSCVTKAGSSYQKRWV
jgi:hypothetical protein